ncbi:MAG: hypothetical protein XD78_2192 [Desulfotomaculum sp. 46_296]|nr:MAG: hypothetical protein XD78_2192 [Desulfotomaculum sp. 46_296]
MKDIGTYYALSKNFMAAQKHYFANWRKLDTGQYIQYYTLITS